MEETTRANGGKVKCELLFDLQILSLTGKVIRRHVISPVAVYGAQVNKGFSVVMRVPIFIFRPQTEEITKPRRKQFSKCASLFDDEKSSREDELL